MGDRGREHIKWQRLLVYIMWGICDVCTLALTVAKTSSHYDRFATFGTRTFRHKTFRQQDGGRRFGNFLLPKRLWCRNVFTAGERRFGNKFSVLSPSNVGAYSVYAGSPSPSQRPAPTTIASRSPFPLGLCSCSTSLSKMGI